MLRKTFPLSKKTLFFLETNHTKADHINYFLETKNLGGLNPGLETGLVELNSGQFRVKKLVFELFWVGTGPTKILDIFSIISKLSI